MSGPVVLKLGGSVITEKATPETVAEGALDRAVAAIADATVDSLVIVHGGGSFGHHHADRVGVSDTNGTHDAPGIYAVHDAMRRLNDAVLERMHDAGVDALPVHPLSAGARDSAGGLRLPVDAVETQLHEGFTPVTHGDVVAHAGRGATVLSGDELVGALATALDASRVGVCSGVPGVLDPDGDVIERIEDYEAVADTVGTSETTDVTGGMAGKVRELLALPMPARVFDLEGLDAFLAGEAPGTLIEGT